MGRVHPIKRLDLLGEAVARLAIPDVQLVIAGPDEGHRQALEPLFARFGVRAHWLGPVESADKADAFAESMKGIMAKLQPIPRAGSVDDIANAAVFLASDESSFINGHDLVVDGGVVGGRLWTPHQEGVKAMRQAFGVDEI